MRGVHKEMLESGVEELDRNHMVFPLNTKEKPHYTTKEETVIEEDVLKTK